jgi:hypothetical protein
VAALDRAAFGADRGELLRRTIADTSRPVLTVRDDQHGVTGYALTRPGTRAEYVGPVIADDLRAAEILLSAALPGRPTFIDVNTGFPGAADLVQRLGFTRQRELLRMRLGPDARVGLSERVFAIAGPEVG